MNSFFYEKYPPARIAAFFIKDTFGSTNQSTLQTKKSSKSLQL